VQAGGCACASEGACACIFSGGGLGGFITIRKLLSGGDCCVFLVVIEVGYILIYQRETSSSRNVFFFSLETSAVMFKLY